MLTDIRLRYIPYSGLLDVLLPLPLASSHLFYLQLSSVIEGCKAGEIPLLLGDFNARVGPERAGYEDVVGPHTGSLCGGARTENGPDSWTSPGVTHSGSQGLGSSGRTNIVGPGTLTRAPSQQR